MMYLVVGVFVVLAGVGTGWFFSGSAQADSGVGAPETKTTETVSGDQEVGVTDEDTFSDTAEGVLEEGGLYGEGTHTLIRGGDESKYVALTSTIIDLDGFVGREVQVWGQSLSSQKAPWLMDVGKLRTK